jgi:hypothetical protein
MRRLWLNQHPREGARRGVMWTRFEARIVDASGRGRRRRCGQIGQGFSCPWWLTAFGVGASIVHCPIAAGRARTSLYKLDEGLRGVVRLRFGVFSTTRSPDSRWWRPNGRRADRAFFRDFLFRGALVYPPHANCSCDGVAGLFLFALQVLVTAVSLVTTLSAFSTTSSRIRAMAALQRAFYPVSLRMG